VNAPSAATEPGCGSVTKTHAQAGKDEADGGQVSGAVNTVRLVVAAAGLVGAGIWAGIGGSKKPVRVGVRGTRLAV
jgi:hypothetical protein